METWVAYSASGHACILSFRVRFALQLIEWARLEVMDKYLTQSPTGFPLLGCGTQLALSQAVTLGLTAALSFPVLRKRGGFQNLPPLRRG